MIHNQVEFERAQEEVRYLKGFLTRVERSPEEPNKDLTIIGIYKKLGQLWDELEAYYRERLELAANAGPRSDAAPPQPPRAGLDPTPNARRRPKRDSPHRPPK